jgi:glycosyltransferase involved in cell wall biosynthesis
MHLFINASAASAGGGLTWLRNVIPHLAGRTDVKTTLLAARGAIGDSARCPGITLMEPKTGAGAGAGGRFWREQLALPAILRRCGCDVLVSAGNMAVFRSPVPQILLARNALYTCRDFYADTWRRGDLRLWLGTRLRGWIAKYSILRAGRVIAPSEAFAVDLRAWAGRPGDHISTIPHGFDPRQFFKDHNPLPEAVRAQLAPKQDHLRLLFVSHYNYFRNFDTLLRALPLIKARIPGKTVQLVLTCRLHPSPAWGPYNATRTESLVQALGIERDIIELGLVPYPQLHQVYRACDIYVSPAYAESFAHPLVEAMACGLPVAASDLPVHREVCGGAARYFPRFSPDTLADCVAAIAGSGACTREMGARGRRRSQDFSWKKHVDQLIAAAASLADECGSGAEAAGGVSTNRNAMVQHGPL